MDQSKITEHLKSNKNFYLSITGLKVKSFWKYIFFIRHAVLSNIQASKSAGILFMEVKKINGIEHTLTAWDSKDSMKKFIYSGHHLKAIKVFKKIATGKTFGYETTELPSWENVHELWLKNGAEY